MSCYESKFHWFLVSHLPFCGPVYPTQWWQYTLSGWMCANGQMVLYCVIFAMHIRIVRMSSSKKHLRSDNIKKLRKQRAVIKAESASLIIRKLILKQDEESRLQKIKCQSCTVNVVVKPWAKANLCFSLNCCSLQTQGNQSPEVNFFYLTQVRNVKVIFNKKLLMINLNYLEINLNQFRPLLYWVLQNWGYSRQYFNTYI